MARKKASLKDKNVFKRSSGFSTLFGSGTDDAPETPPVEVPEVTSAAVSASFEPAHPPEAPLSPEVGEALESVASLATETTASEPDSLPAETPEPVVEVPIEAAAPTKPDVEPLPEPISPTLTPNLPTGEAALDSMIPADDNEAALPADAEADIVTPVAEIINSEVAELDPYRDFPVASEVPPIDMPAFEYSGVGEIGYPTPPIDEYRDFPTAMEAPPPDYINGDWMTTEAPTEIASAETEIATEDANLVDPDLLAGLYPEPEAPPTAFETAEPAVDSGSETTDLVEPDPAAPTTPFDVPANLPEDVTLPTLDEVSTVADEFDSLPEPASDFEEPVSPETGGFEFSQPATDQMPPVSVRPVPPPPPPQPVQPASTFATESATTPPPIADSVSHLHPLSFASDDVPADIFELRDNYSEGSDFPFELPSNLAMLTPEERENRRKLLEDPRVRQQFTQVYRDIDRQYKVILDSNVSVNKEITDWAQKLLGETRHIVMNYQIQYLAKAEWNIEQVKARLDRAEESVKTARRWGIWITLWGMIWFFAFIYLIFRPDDLLQYFNSQLLPNDLLVLNIFLRTMFFGGIGGVAAVFYSLLRYVARRSFDSQWLISYFNKPFMGMIVGTLIYLLVFMVMRVLNIPFAFQAGNDNGTLNLLAMEVLAYFLAASAGFKENLVFDLMSRILKFIFRDKDEGGEVEPPPPPPGPFALES